MPEYIESLAILQTILDFQDQFAEKIEPALGIEHATARRRWAAGAPLFAGETWSISPQLFREALTELLPLLPEDNLHHTTLERLLGSDVVAPPNDETLLVEMIASDETCVQRLADALPADAAMLHAIFEIALSPFYTREAAPYQEWIETSGWRHGYCPVCGSKPAMARLAREGGRRLLSCSLCRSEWGFDRLRCPFCEADGSPKMRYFTLDGGESYRVACCDHCRRYLKTVDDRVLGQRSNLAVEDMISVRLDEAAREQGYH
ncbi:MAG: formate dehydrogenase accessory protein FdhE [Chloroflexi bacterium]|nr:formate dehydrogenase accessory protein FdhE [Chloroflexota bacterium]